MVIFIGTYTGSGSVGIYVYQLDPATGELRFTGQTAEAENPSFLAVDRERGRLFAANELGQWDGRPGGAVSSFSFDPAAGALTFINQVSSHGKDPCYVSVDPTGRCVLAANYSSGSVAAFPVLEGGRLGEAATVIQHEGSGPNRGRQEGPHAHCFMPQGEWALACDLGVDKVFVYRMDAASAGLVPNDPPFASVHPGAGPRHIAFHPNDALAYVINELDNTLCVFGWDRWAGTLTHRQTVSTVPEGFTGTSHPAEVKVHPSGRWVYGSNRGHDSLAVFRAEDGGARLAPVAYQPVEGKNPRNFAVDPTGRFLVVANQDTDNLVTFRVDEVNGRLTPTGHQASVPKPVCVCFFG